MILCAGGFVISAKALFTMDLIGSVKLSTVDCDERSVIQNLKLAMNIAVF